ncbi:trypsin-4-like isoform X2 [Anoplophora glabripennis]|uniref:trypsin-4-like isoform X2 n=1 Tax=Anoplophora glabripennis TaxID=217634 RepID=UPI000873F2D0|nr:trypsin-4-like isoform X2 [Anoplophora glabripennis]
MHVVTHCILLLTSVLLLGDSDCALERIIGGRQAYEQEFPYQLSLMRNGHIMCGATLVSQDIALTAAHCLPKRGLYSVRAGSIYMDKGGVVSDVKEAILHPGYDSNTEDYDLAILKLSKHLPLSEDIRPVRLPEQDESPPRGVKGYVTGWGSVSAFEDFIPEELRVLEIPVLERETCEDIYDSVNIITKRMFCAGYRQGGRDSCQGDSGGPFVINETLYGLVSWGFNCGEPGYPGVYTNVSALRSYIKLNAHL